MTPDTIKSVVDSINNLKIIFPDSLYVLHTAKPETIVIWGLTKTQLITICAAAGVSLFVFFGGIIFGRYTEGLKAYRQIKELKLFIINWLKVVIEEANLELNSLQKYKEEMKEKITEKIVFIHHHSISTDELLEIKHLDLHKIFVLRSKAKINNLRVQHLLFSSLNEVKDILNGMKKRESEFLNKLQQDECKIDGFVWKYNELKVSTDHKVQGEFLEEFIPYFQKIDEAIYDYDSLSIIFKETSKLILKYAYKDSTNLNVINEEFKLQNDISFNTIRLERFKNDHLKFNSKIEIMLENQVQNLVLIHNYLEVIKITKWLLFEPISIFKPFTYKKYSIKMFDNNLREINNEIVGKRIALDENNKSVEAKSEVTA